MLAFQVFESYCVCVFVCVGVGGVCVGGNICFVFIILVATFLILFRLSFFGGEAMPCFVS